MNKSEGGRVFREGPSDRLVATSHPLATEAAYRLLDEGASPVDAAVAAAAVLCVVEPGSTGIGGDLFAQVWPAGDPGPATLCAVGPAPELMTVDAVREQGWTQIPRTGPWSITVPGAPGGWDTLIKEHGTVPMDRLLRPAIEAAETGFVVTPRVARDWARSEPFLREFKGAAELFLPNGKAPLEGEFFVNPPLAATLRRLASRGIADFYEGAIGEAIGRAVETAGGPLRLDDLARWDGPEWVEPLTAKLGDVTLYLPPPPGQGLVALLALALYEQMRSGDTAIDTHLAIESLKVGFEQGQQHIGDPKIMQVEATSLLDPSYLQSLGEGIDPDRAMTARVGRGSDTVYVAVADAEHGACSLIQSVYQLFGSGMVVPELGVLLHDRGADFDLESGHPNQLSPGRRPYHTILPGVLGRDGAFAGCIGVVGGYMQPQGQLQVLRNLIEGDMSPQQAVAAPRFRAYSGRRLALEQGWPPEIRRSLESRGHEVEVLEGDEAGGAQLIIATERGLEAGSDPRKDGLQS